MKLIIHIGEDDGLDIHFHTETQQAQVVETWPNGEIRSSQMIAMGKMLETLRKALSQT